MKTINITDLFGIQIKESKIEPNIILITVLDKQKILFPKALIENEGIICSLNTQLLKEELLKNGLNENYLPFGDIWIKENYTGKITIPLGYKNSGIFSEATNFVASQKYSEGIVWSLENNKNGFNSIGFAFSKKYPIDKYLLIDSKYIGKYRGSIKKGTSLCTSNEFPLLSSIKAFPYTIDRSFFNNDKISSWLFHRGEHMVLDINLHLTNDRKLENKVILENNRLTISNHYISIDSNNNVKLTSKKGTKWYPFYNEHGCMIVLNCSNKCLSIHSFDGALELANILAQNHGKYWEFENDIESIMDNTEYLGSKSWTTEEGNNVILTVPDDPWFNNREAQLDPEIILQKPRIETIVQEKEIPKEQIDKNYSQWYMIMGLIVIFIFYIYFRLRS